jgi:hypothetical protein
MLYLCHRDTAKKYNASPSTPLKWSHMPFNISRLNFSPFTALNHPFLGEVSHAALQVVALVPPLLPWKSPALSSLHAHVSQFWQPPILRSSPFYVYVFGSQFAQGNSIKALVWATSSGFDFSSLEPGQSLWAVTSLGLVPACPLAWSHMHLTSIASLLTHVGQLKLEICKEWESICNISLTVTISMDDYFYSQYI